MLFVGFFLCTLLLSAQRNMNKDFVNIRMVPDHQDWTYKVGEKPRLKVSVEKSTTPVGSVMLTYAIGPEMMAPTLTKKVTLKDGTGTIDMGTVKEPGFLTCRATVVVDGTTYSNWVTVGFEPEKIQPTVPYPKDFVEYWEGQKEIADRVPLDVEMQLLPDRCTAKVNVYEVSYAVNKSGARFYGILCIPKAEGKYPAVLHVPGAGVRPYNGVIDMAEKGIITLQVGIHGIPVTYPDRLYRDLRTGILQSYNTYNLDQRENYYYNRVYIGCKRGVDVIFSLPQFDGERVAVTGGSQGGALSVVVAALDSRIKCLSAFYPALSDMTGYLHNRAGGWPHMLRNAETVNRANNTKEKLETISYYDVVNFARQLKVPVFFSWGYNDQVCPPTSTYSVYNVVTAPKYLMLMQETAHWAYPEQYRAGNDFILKQFNLK